MCICDYLFVYFRICITVCNWILYIYIYINMYMYYIYAYTHVPNSWNTFVYSVHRTWRVLASDALGIETYMQKEHTVHSPSMYSKIVWWFFSLSAFSLHFPKMIFCWVTTAILTVYSFDKLQLLRKLKTASSHLFLKKLLGFWQRMAGYLAALRGLGISPMEEISPIFFPRSKKRLKNPTYPVLYVLKIYVHVK